MELTKNKATSKELQEINIDLIKQLKREGKYAEAEELLQAYRENNKNMWKQEYNEQIREERKICKVKGVCYYCRKRPNIHKDTSYCHRCYEKYHGKPYQYKIYTHKEKRLLFRLREQKVPYKTISQIMNRSESSLAKLYFRLKKSLYEEL